MSDTTSATVGGHHRRSPETTAQVADKSTQIGPPSARRGRIIGIDVARGLAILGMIAVHSLNQYNASGDPTWTYSLDAGRSAAIFAVLAGVSIALITGRRQLRRGPSATGQAAALIARALIIGVIGLALGYTDSQYGVVILAYYAVMFLLAVPLIYLGTRTLVALTIAFGVGLPVLSQWLRPHLPEMLEGQPSFDMLLQEPLSLASTLLFTGEYPALVWMTYVAAGLVLGRLALSSARVAAKLLGTGLALMAGASGLSWLVLNPLGGLDQIRGYTDSETVSNILAFGSDGSTPTTTWWWLGVGDAHTGTPIDLMATIGSTLAILGAILLLGHLRSPVLAGMTRVLLAPLAAIGAMSLTIYTAHIMFINSDFDVYSAWAGYVRQLIFMIVFALIWRATAGRGPLEGLVAAMTKRVCAGAQAWSASRVAPVAEEVAP